MRRIAIQDANILIDLVKTELFARCLGLEFQFSTTDIILAELYPEQIATIQKYIDEGRIAIITINETELVEIQLMSLEDTRISEQDWSAIYFAMQQEAILLTGDRHMRAMAGEKSIKCHGIFWLLDQLVETKLISFEEASQYLKKLMSVNKRLPLVECNSRLKKWGS